MPIRRENMESTNGMDLTEDTNHGKIYQFLKERDSLAYTREEISRLLNIPVGSVGPSLTRLKQEGLVEHQGQYWTIHQDETEGVTQHGSKNNDGDDINEESPPSVTELLQEDNDRGKSDRSQRYTLLDKNPE